MGNSQGKPVEFDGEGVFYLPRLVIPATHPQQFTAGAGCSLPDGITVGLVNTNPDPPNKQRT